MEKTILYPNREYHATIRVDQARFNFPIRVQEITTLRIGDSITYKNMTYTLKQNSKYSEYAIFTCNNMQVYLRMN